MGIDIHMHIIDKDGKVLAKEIFDGRNSEWFSDLRGDGWNDEYYHLPSYFGFPEGTPKEITKYDGMLGYFGFYYMVVGDFKDWFNKYRPDLKAGWASTYDKWRIEKKHYIPDELPTNLSAEDDKDNMHFVEYENIYDCSKWLYKYLEEENFPDDAYISYYFDN